MPELVRRIAGRARGAGNGVARVEREWIVTNGLGGYASGNVAGANTRRYHGLLIAALPAPVGRVVMLNQITERVRLPDGSQVHLDLHELSGSLPEPKAVATLTEFRLECGLPVWSYASANSRSRSVSFSRTGKTPSTSSTGWCPDAAACG
jgi:predicted glycogen debranching enzyme